MAKVYVVKSAGVLANVTGGGLSQLLQRGAVLPDNIDPDQLRHLLANDLVVEGELVGGLEAVLTGDLAEVVTEPGPAGDAGSDTDGTSPTPAKSADKPTWVEHAVTRGMSREDAEKATKDELIALFGTPAPANPGA